MQLNAIRLLFFLWIRAEEINFLWELLPEIIDNFFGSFIPIPEFLKVNTSQRVIISKASKQIKGKARSKHPLVELEILIIFL